MGWDCGAHHRSDRNSLGADSQCVPYIRLIKVFAPLQPALWLPREEQVNKSYIGGQLCDVRVIATSAEALYANGCTVPRPTLEAVSLARSHRTSAKNFRACGERTNARRWTWRSLKERRNSLCGETRETRIRPSRESVVSPLGTLPLASCFMLRIPRVNWSCPQRTRSGRSIAYRRNHRRIRAKSKGLRQPANSRRVVGAWHACWATPHRTNHA